MEIHVVVKSILDQVYDIVSSSLCYTDKSLNYTDTVTSARPSLPGEHNVRVWAMVNVPCTLWIITKHEVLPTFMTIYTL